MANEVEEHGETFLLVIDELKLSLRRIQQQTFNRIYANRRVRVDTPSIEY